MLCGVCWRAPWPTQPAATGHMALWRLAYPLAAWHCGLLAGGRPFPVAGIVSLSQCGGVGIRGGHLPGVQAGPIRQYILGSGHLLRSERGELRSFPPQVGVGSPGEALEASAGHHPDELWEGDRNGWRPCQSGASTELYHRRSVRIALASRLLPPAPHLHATSL